MRALVVLIILLGSLVFILVKPWIGVLVWSWLSYMNPHRIAYGFIQQMPVAMIVALTTFTAMLLADEKEKATMRIAWTRETKVLLALTAWMFMTTVFSLYPDAAWPQWDKVWRIMLITGALRQGGLTAYRIKVLVYVIALSIGIFSLLISS